MAKRKNSRKKTLQDRPRNRKGIDTNTEQKKGYMSRNQQNKTTTSPIGFAFPAFASETQNYPGRVRVRL
jgi:hypothetical protein